LVTEIEGRTQAKVFVNSVFRRIFWPRRDEVTGEWRKLHHEELNPWATNVIYIWSTHS